LTDIDVPDPNLDDDVSATTFERYFKRTLATLIKRECQQSSSSSQKSVDRRCTKIRQDLNEEHIIFTSYQCSKDMKTSRLWMVVLVKPDQRSMNDAQETTPQEEEHFVDGQSIARVLTSASVLPQLNSHLSPKRSRVVNVDHSRLDDTFKRTKETQKFNRPRQFLSTTKFRDEVTPSKPEQEKSRQGSVATNQAMMDDHTDRETLDADVEEVKPARFNWVGAVVGGLFVAYFIIVWVLAVVFCVKKRRETQAKNRRLRGDTRAGDTLVIQDEKQKRRIEFLPDPSTTKKLMSRDEEGSDYDNN